MFSAFACRTRERSCARSIIFLRSTNPLWRARLPKIVLQRQLSDLGMQNLQIDGRSRRLVADATENARRALQKLSLPGRIPCVHRWKLWK
jgi:hypothetical protein